MIKKVKALDCWLDKIAPILTLLLIGLVLRIPNLFEPYWYGDEAIYLTIGNALKSGSLLYRDIVDHKTPLIYYLAMVPNQMWFRFLNIIWASASTVVFYTLARRVVRGSQLVFIASLLYVVFTSLPMLEGNIPNGELFVMGFILTGGLLFFSNFIHQYVGTPDERLVKKPCQLPLLTRLSKKWGTAGNWTLYYLGGILMGLGVMTKVPAIFDVAAFFSVAWFFYVDQLKVGKLTFKKVKDNLAKVFGTLFVAILGVATPLVISILYYNLKGTGADYLDFGLLYNFRYVQNWQLPFESPILVELFTLRAKFVVAFAFILIMTLWGKKLSLRFKFVATWLILAVFASTLSNRPYPHYYLQVIPPASLVFALVVGNFAVLNKKVRAKLKERSRSLEIVTGIVLLGLMIKVFILLEVGFYPTVSYYQNFSKFISGQMSREEYYRSFDQLTTDNYKASSIIQKSDSPYLFIWGTNPVLYAQTQKVPTGRFTVSFHVRDFNAYEETLNDFIDKKPMFAVMMNDAEEIDGLNEYLTEYYVPNYDFDNFVLWKRNGVNPQ